MIADIKQKRASVKRQKGKAPNVEWMGKLPGQPEIEEEIVNRREEKEQQEMAYELEELILGDESDEESTATLAVAYFDSDEEREEEIFEEETQPSTPQNAIPQYEGKSRLEALRMYLENKLGKNEFTEAYTLVKLIDQMNITGPNLDRYVESLNMVLPPDTQHEFLPLIHSLIFLEGSGNN